MKRSPPATKASTPPIPPMRLIIPFAWDRLGDGVISPMKDITGVRKRSMAKRVRKIAPIKNTKELPTKMGIDTKPINAIGAPMMINGFLLPIFVHIRSDMAPIHGKMSNAAILSKVIIKPVQLADIPNPVTPAVVL